jgi:uncharacterized protein (DUF2342 family)
MRKKQGDANVASARELARQAAQRVGPMAKSAREGAANRIHGARGWAAPRIEQAAHTVRQDVGPKVSSILEATAQRIEPAQTQAKKLGRRANRRAARASQDVSARRAKILANAQSSGRSWPKAVGGVAFVLATVGAVVTVVLRRRDNGGAGKDDADMAGEDETGEPRSAADAEVTADGQVRAP